MKIGIIGAGAIAQFLLEQLNKEQSQFATVKALFVRDIEKYTFLSEQYGVELYTEFSEFLAADFDVVVEAAELEAVKTFIPIAVQQKPVVLISIGALVDEQLLADLQRLAASNGQAIYLPSGAIGGLDLLQNANALSGVTEVVLTTRKPASSLTNERITESCIIFEGNAKAAIEKFPKNMNVSIVLALAGLGFEETKVKLVADPFITQNIHEIEIHGAFGEATIRVKNNPLPVNPKTSYLAAMSILETLKRFKQNLTIG